MDGPAYFQMFAAYNQWANTRLYDAAGRMTPEELNRDCGAYFGSLLGTLNHLLVGDLIWMARIEGAGDFPDQLDAILHPELGALRAAREREDTRMIAYAAGLTEDLLAQEMTFTRVSDGTVQTEGRAEALAHMFNHQTHHRGQAHGLITHLGHAAPPLDLLFFRRALTTEA